MKYKRYYNNLIRTRMERNPEDIQGEWHHIIPRSMGGSDDIENLIKLTYREHFIAHLLLYKIHKNASMAYALNRMKNTKQHILNSWSYDFVRSIHSEAVSKWSKEYMKNKKTLRNIHTGEIRRFEKSENVSSDWVGLNYGNRYSNEETRGFGVYRLPNGSAEKLHYSDPKIANLGLKSVGCTKNATIVAAENQKSRPWYAKNPINEEFVLLIPSIYNWYITKYDEKHPKKTGQSAWARSEGIIIFTKLIRKAFLEMRAGWVPDKQFNEILENVKKNRTNERSVENVPITTESINS